MPHLGGCWQSGQALPLYAGLMRAPDLVSCAVLKDLIRKEEDELKTLGCTRNKNVLIIAACV